MKKRFDKSRVEMKLQPGSKVLIALTDRERSRYPVRKLAPRWSAIATVVRELSNGVTYVIAKENGKEANVHVSRLLPLDGTLWGKLFPPTTLEAKASARRVVEEEKPAYKPSAEELEPEVDWHWEWAEPTPIRKTSTGLRPVPLSEMRGMPTGVGCTPMSPGAMNKKPTASPAPKRSAGLHGRLGPTGPPVGDFVKGTLAAEPRFEVERLTGRRKIRGKWKYRVRWTGYDESESTWEPRRVLLEDCPDMVREYDAKVKSTMGPRKGRRPSGRQVRSVAWSDVRVLVQ